MRLGMHLPSAGRPAGAAERAAEIGCQALQVFSGNPRGWAKPPLDPAGVAEFQAAVREAKLEPLVVHATYLINLAAPDEEIYRLSLAAIQDELRRAATLGARFYVIHCGSHKGAGEQAGRARVREALKRALDQPPPLPQVLLENTAGAANSLGTAFRDLAALMAGFPAESLGLCFDTCHALAAGYEVRRPEGLAAALAELDRDLGWERLKLLHVNDSKGGLASHLDRHEHIGAGQIGKPGFRTFFSEPRLRPLPAILETPQDHPEEDRTDLHAAMKLAASAGALDPAVLSTLSPAPAVSKKTAKSRPILPASRGQAGAKGNAERRPRGTPKPR